MRATREANDTVVGMVRDIGANIGRVKAAMEVQARAVADVGSQTEQVNRLSSSISDATGERFSSMNETMKSVQRIAELTQVIAGSTDIIIGHVQTIHRTAVEMEARAQGID